MGTRDLGNTFVTGADGFIGSHLVDKLIERQVHVTALCQYNSIGSFGWLEKYSVNCPPNLRLVHGDIRDARLMEDLARDQDTVFHLASLIAIPYSYRAPQSYLDTNITGTLNVAMASLRAGVTRMIHTSTSEVYGTARKVPIDEDHPLQGQSPYAASKIGADKVIESLVRSFGLPAITLRPFNTYGPRQSLRAVIPTIVAQAMLGQKEVKLGSLTPTRDFNYVSDTASAFLAVAQISDENKIGETFNAGSGKEIAIGDLVQLIGRILKFPLNVIQESDRLRPEKSEVERLLADASKLRAVTGWEPKITLEQGIVRVAEWIAGCKGNINATRYGV